MILFFSCKSNKEIKSTYVYKKKDYISYNYTKPIPNHAKLVLKKDTVIQDLNEKDFVDEEKKRLESTENVLVSNNRFDFSLPTNFKKLNISQIKKNLKSSGSSSLNSWDKFWISLSLLLCISGLILGLNNLGGFLFLLGFFIGLFDLLAIVSPEYRKLMNGFFKILLLNIAIFGTIIGLVLLADGMIGYGIISLVAALLGLIAYLSV